MYGVILNEIEGAQDFCEEFKGYNHNIRRGSGEFYDMKNMTMDLYPIISTRKSRSISVINDIIAEYSGQINGVKPCFDGYIAIVKGNTLIITGISKTTYSFDLNALNTQRQLVCLGNSLIIFPDKKQVTMNKTSGNVFEIDDLAREFTAKAIFLAPCDSDGNGITITTQKQDGEPEDKSIYWFDTTDSLNEFKKWSDALKTWVAVDMYIEILFLGNQSINKGQSFTVKMTNTKGENENIYNGLKLLFGENGENIINVSKVTESKRMVIKLNSTNSGIISVSPLLTHKITFNVKVIVPNFDYVCEGNNRIWGCRYGLDYKGDFVNEIYCSALGDFSSWYCYEGASTDSYTLSLGVEGEFLNAVFYGGRPVFFKENAILTIYGDYPANFQLNTINTKGIQKGSSQSVAVTENGIFYKGNNGIYLYDGSMPINVSTALGNEKYFNAVAGAKGYKYYISMIASDNKPNLFVFDYSNGFWVKEDDTKAECFVNFGGDLLMLANNNSEEKFYLLETDTDEEQFDWFFETGTFGYSQAENKYIGRFNIRMRLEDGARADLWIQYDSSGHFEHLGSMKGVGLQSYNLPVVPHRCDHFNIKLSGKGKVQIFSIAKMLYSGGVGI